MTLLSAPVLPPADLATEPHPATVSTSQPCRRRPVSRPAPPAALTVSACGLAGGTVGWAGGWVLGFAVGSVALLAAPRGRDLVTRVHR